jgi:probable HAF family extracellular repeat protein
MKHEPMVEPSVAYDVVPLDVQGVLHSLNNRGECVGDGGMPDGSTQAIYLQPAGLAPLGTLGGSSSSARAISDSGAIVGGALTHGDLAYHAFLHQHGEMVDLNTLIEPEAGWELILALGINDRGEILALAERDGSDQAVLLKPRSSGGSQ